MNDLHTRSSAPAEHECFIQLCTMLETNPSLAECRIRFTARPDYSTIRDCLDEATRHNLRCWFTGHSAIIQSRYSRLA